MKAIKNPVKRIYIKESKSMLNYYKIIMELDVVMCENTTMNIMETYHIYPLETAKRLRDELLDRFGITIIKKISKLKPITFANMIIEQ